MEHDKCLDAAGNDKAKQKKCDDDLRDKARNESGCVAWTIWKTFSGPLPGWWHSCTSTCKSIKYTELKDRCDPDCSGSSLPEQPGSISVHGHIVPKKIESTTVILNPGLSFVLFSLLWGGSDLNLSLQTPNGTMINPTSKSSLIYYSKNFGSIDYIIENPVPGNWTIKIDPIEVPALGENYTLRISPIGKNDATLDHQVVSYVKDLNDDGKYDLLAMDVGINASTYGKYSVLGSLCDLNGSEIDWSIGSHVLTPGLHIITLNFSGNLIRTHKINGPYRLQDLTLLEGASETNLTVCDIDIGAYSTSALNYSDFGDQSRQLQGK